MENYYWKLDEDYHIRAMTSEEFDPLFKKHTKELFIDRTQVFQMRNSLTQHEHDQLKKLNTSTNQNFELNLGVFHKSEFIGWHFGRQDSYFSFYMQNSGILPQHRRKGLYNELLKRILEVTTQLGFQDIWSRHNATNNAVIIPKLKQGFIISAIEVTDIFGTLIHLHYFPKELRRRMMDYRVGQIKPDTEIKTLLGI